MYSNYFASFGLSKWFTFCVDYEALNYSLLIASLIGRKLKRFLCDCGFGVIEVSDFPPLFCPNLKWVEHCYSAYFSFLTSCFLSLTFTIRHYFLEQCNMLVKKEKYINIQLLLFHYSKYCWLEHRHFKHIVATRQQNRLMEVPLCSIQLLLNSWTFIFNLLGLSHYYLYIFWKYSSPQHQI